jgi:hypothetical protein
MVMTQKQKVALELLDCALQMYFEKSYFAAIHLAGAAEELFGKYLAMSKEAVPAADAIYEHVAQRFGYTLDTAPRALKTAVYQRIFHSRNRTKHLDPEGDHDITFDPRREAEVGIHRAMSNFLEVAVRLRIELTPNMLRYDEEEWDAARTQSE